MTDASLASLAPPAPKIEPMPPIPVTIIGGTGDGHTPVITGVVGTTPDHFPNYVALVVSPLLAVVVRFSNQFLTTLVGLLTAAMTPLGADLVPTKDFLHLIAVCASLSVAGAGVGAIKDVITILGGLERKFPIASGSV